MFSIKNLSFAYGDNQIFDNLNLDIDARLSFLKGKNGSGKTTLLKLIHGDIKDYTGEIISDDAYMVSQSFMLFDELSILENIALAIAKDKREVEEILSQSPFKVADISRNVKELSTIEKETLELIAMSLSDKKLILLDEVSASLDYEMTMKLKDYILSSDKTFIIVSHDEDFVKLFDAKEIYLDKVNALLKVEAACEEKNASHKKIFGVYLKDDEKLKELIKEERYAYVPKDVREIVLMDECTYKNICIYDILKKRDIDYIEEAESFIEKYNLKFKAKDITHTLSGGNLQKLVFFREILRDEDAYYLYNYRKGMDFEAKALAQKEILKRRDEGRKIIIISDDYEELKEDIVDEIKII